MALQPDFPQSPNDELDDSPATTPQTEVCVYEPGQRAGWRLSIWRDIFRELAGSRELIWRLFVRDFLARYKQTALGFLWVVITPLVAVGTFMFLQKSGILNIGDVGIPYPAWALLGLSIWQLFAGGVMSCNGSITAGGSMVVKINFPKETLVFVAMSHTVVDVLIRLALVVVVFALYGIAPAWTVILFPLSLVPLFLFTLGLGLLLAALNSLVRDVGNFVSLVTIFLLFMTPVLWTQKPGLFAEVSKYNPLSGLLSAPRDLVISGFIKEPFHYLWASVFSFVLFWVAWRVFHIAEIRIAERMGAR